MANEHILVVEDEEDILELVRYNLAQEGYRVTGVGSGEEGLRAARARRAAIPVAAIDRTLQAIYVKIAVGGGIIALLAVALSLAISRRLTRPLEEMKQATSRFAQGDLSRKVPVPDSDELASLAEALNQMAAQLDDRIRTILRQRHEQEMILSSMVEGVIAVDTQGRLITLNQAGTRLMRVDTATIQNRSV